MREFITEDSTVIVSDQDILNCYFPLWKDRMISLGREHLVSYELCIADWVTKNNAKEIGM